MLHDISAGNAWNISAVGHNEVEGHRVIIICGRVWCTLHVELLCEYRKYEILSVTHPFCFSHTNTFQSFSFLPHICISTHLQLHCHDNHLNDTHREHDFGGEHHPSRMDPDRERIHHHHHHHHCLVSSSVCKNLHYCSIIMLWQQIIRVKQSKFCFVWVEVPCWASVSPVYSFGSELSIFQVGPTCSFYSRQRMCCEDAHLLTQGQIPSKFYFNLTDHRRLLQRNW